MSNTIITRGNPKFFTLLDSVIEHLISIGGEISNVEAFKDSVLEIQFHNNELQLKFIEPLKCEFSETKVELSL